MIDKINVSEIIRGHLLTMRSFRAEKPAWRDFIFFFGFPLLTSIVLVSANASLTESSRGIIATGLSIFAGLLFSLLLLVADIAVRSDEGVRGTNRSQLRIKLTVLRELHSNIAFAILISLTTLIGVISLSLEGSLPGRWFVEAVTYYLFVLFLLTLFMILKRAHALIGQEVREAERIAS